MSHTAEEILTYIRARDEKGLRLLYQHYSGSLYGMALRILQQEEYAEEALQNTFLKVWNHIDQYNDDRSTLFTWMANILKNSCIDIKRLQSFQKQSKTDSLQIHVHDNRTSAINSSNLDVQQLLIGMDEKYQQVLEYLYIQGYSQSELSQELDLPIGTIKTRVKKAMELLREKLKHEKTLFITVLPFAIIVIKSLDRWVYKKSEHRGLYSNTL